VSEIILFDNGVRPDRRNQIVFLDEAAGAGHKHAERIEHFPAQTDRAPVT
jgi:hypothetical protein